MAIGKMYGNAFKLALQKEIDIDTDAIKVMLCTSSYVPNQDTHIYKDVSITNEIANGNGYTTGGKTLTTPAVTYDAGTNVIKFAADNVTWDASTFTARYAVIYDDTPASNKPLIAYVDFETDQASNNGAFTLTWNASGIFGLTVA